VGVTAVSEPPESGSEAKKYSYKNNYKGKNPMTRTQWRRYQRQKKLAIQSPNAGGNIKVDQKIKLAKKPTNEKVYVPVETSEAENEKNTKNEDDYMDDDLSDDEDDFTVLVNVVSILPVEYDVPSEVTEEDNDFEESDMANHKPVCYYVMRNGCVEEQQAVYEKPHEGMKNHLKPLFIRAKINNVGVSKVLIDEGAAVNLMPHSLLKKIGKFDTDLHTHNIVLSNYQGKTGHSMGAIQVDVCVGSTVRPTLFLVVPSKANFNLLLGREWIHGVGAVPSTLHQRLIIWRDDGLVENWQ
jgi:hypothetical protein